MLDISTKRRIDTARDILVGKVPDPKAQVEQITTALIYKFMDDMDKEAEELGGTASFFVDGYRQYAWSKLLDPRLGGFERLSLYAEALAKMPQNQHLPQLFRDIFKDAFLPYRDPETLNLFLKEINGFTYDHSERLGDAFEYLLSVLGSQGDAGQFRTPRHIIDFIVNVVDPKKEEHILDPACGTAGFLISAYKHILKQNSVTRLGDQLTPDEKTKLMSHFAGYDISPEMVRLSLVNMYLHGFPKPNIHEYDSLTSEERWDETYDVIMANPPFMSPKGGIRPHKRFSTQASRSEVLFVDYIAEHLSTSGRAGVIVPEGIIFQSGNAYKALRKMLVEKYLWAVVSLPGGVFQPYSGVKTSILLMDKTLAKKVDSILFVRVENDGFDLGAQRRPIEKNDLPHALAILQGYKSALQSNEDPSATLSAGDGSSIASIAEKAKIAQNGDYSLASERYREGVVKQHQRWELVELGAVCELMTGGTPKSDVKEYYENGTIKWLVSGDIHKGEIFDCDGRITELGMKESNAKMLPVNSVLIALNGQGKTRGTVAILRTEATCNQSLVSINPVDKSKLIPEYLLYILRSRYEDIRAITGDKHRSGLNMPLLRQIRIPLPPPDVQQEIVTELNGYQKVIDGARQVVENYRPTLRPEPGWDVVELGSIARPEYGYTDSARDSGDARFIRITDIDENGTLKNEEPKYIDLSNASRPYLLRRGDILVARTGATYGKTLYFDDDYDAVFASYLIRLHLDTTRILPKFYWAFTLSNDYQKQKASLVQGGGQPQFNGNVIIRLKVPLPSIDIQEQIVAQIEEELGLIDTHKKLIQIFEQKIQDRIAEVWEE